MNHLLREKAPFSTEAWDAIDSEAKQRLVAALAARKVVDFAGPHGWDFSAANLGRIESVQSPAGGLVAARRLVLPVVELRAPFSLSLDELFDVDRGARDIDLAALDDAAHAIAVAENAAVFHGFAAGGITGITEVSPHEPRPLGTAVEDYPRAVASAVEVLLQSGISGPYALVVGPESWTSIVESAETGGHLVLDHLRRILDGPVVWAPGVVGGVVLSTRGGDFCFESGQDLSIGYHHHEAGSVQLYFEESFTFRVNTPDAAVALLP